jgi:poly(A) polymerase
MKEIWAMQPRFDGRSGRRPFRLLEHPRFRAAYDFMLLRCESGEVDEELGRWWEAFQHAGSREREAMLLADETQKKRRRSRSRKKSTSTDKDIRDISSAAADEPTSSTS